MQLWQAVEPALAANVPGGQVSQRVLKVPTFFWPIGHDVHELCPTKPANVPAAHGVQDVAPVAPANEPAVQEVHTALASALA